MIVRVFKAAPLRTSVRLTRPLVADRGSNLLLPLPGRYFPPRLRDGVAAERNTGEAAVSLALHLPSQ